MPLMFGVMSFFFPAGLTLYMFTNTVLSALHSIYMNKFDKKSLASAELLKKNQAQAAAAEVGAAAKASGGGAKGRGEGQGEARDRCQGNRGSGRRFSGR